MYGRGIFEHYEAISKEQQKISVKDLNLFYGRETSTIPYR